VKQKQAKKGQLKMYNAKKVTLKGRPDSEYEAGGLKDQVWECILGTPEKEDRVLRPSPAVLQTLFSGSTH